MADAHVVKDADVKNSVGARAVELNMAPLGTNIVPLHDGNGGGREVGAMTESAGIGRRELLGGGLALGGLLLAGCQGNSTAKLPGPSWPSMRDQGGAIVAKPAPAPAVARVERAPISTTAVTPRSQWTRSGVARPRDINPMNGITRITVHHSGISSTSLRSSTAVARELDNIRAGHVGRGWADIGYHYVIDQQGKIWEARGIQYQGAHVENNNEHNLGIMLLGNFDQQSLSPQSTAALESFVRAQMSRYNVPVSRVYTHRELRPTACPGRSLQSFMVRARGNGGSLT